MRPKTPQEDPEAKAARAKEKVVAGLEQDSANERLASGATSDFRRQNSSGFSLFNMLGLRK